MSIIDLFFNLYDSDKDGTLGIADVLELSKELLCLYQTMQLLDAQHLSSITSLLINALADNIPLETLMMHLDAVLNGEEQLELSLPSFRMVVLTDETLETFFSSNFPESFTLKKGGSR